MHNGSMENSVVTILNVAGKEMMSRQISETVSETQFDVSNLPAGVYFLRFFSNHQLFTRKICITGR
jgi:Secretion system C-terminal sorting domain